MSYASDNSNGGSRQCRLPGGLLHWNIRTLFLGAIRAVHKHQF